MNVTTLIFLGLAVVWAVVLLPELVRKVSGSRRSDTIRSFNHQLSVLDRSGSAGPEPAPRADGRGRSNVIDLTSRSESVRHPSSLRPTPVPTSPWVRKRRQDVLTVLGSAAVLTLICAVAFGGVFLMLHLLVDVALVAYLVALAQVRQVPAAAPVDRRVTAPAEPAAIRRVSHAPRRIAN